MYLIVNITHFVKRLQQGDPHVVTLLRMTDSYNSLF